MPRFSPSRRDLLAAFLGVPAALAAGCSSPPSTNFTGRIIGPSETVGHRLRSGWRPTPHADAWHKRGVVIVGGGIAGLSAAWRLERAGFTDFTLLELEPIVGGTSCAGEGPIVAHPWGAHYVPVPFKENRAFLTLLKEMGVLEGEDEEGEPIIAEQVLCRDPQERIFYKDRWYEGLYLYAGASAEDRTEFDAFQKEIDHWVAWRDGRGRRAFALPGALSSDDPAVTGLDRQSMAEWMDERGFTSPRLRWMIDYACRDDYGTHPASTSAWAGLFYFASRQRRPGEEAQPLMTWPEGNGRIVKHLLGCVTNRVHAGMAVTEVIPTDPAGKKGVDVVAVASDGEQVQGWHADQVIFAAPRFLTRYLLRPYREQPPAHLAAFEYGAWLVANLFLEDRPAEPGFPMCWDNVLYESPSLGYVTATHQRCLDYGPTVLTYYYPLTDENAPAARARLLSLDWQACADITLADLSVAHPDLPGLVNRLDVMRWGHAMVRPRPGFIWGNACATARRPHRGVHFAHSDLSGIALFEEAFYHGLRAAEEVLTARGLEVPSIL